MAVYPDRESLERVLARLVRSLVDDPAFRRAAQAENVLVTFSFPDRRTGFYLHLRGGLVEAAVGESPGEATIAVTMTSADFHEVASGRIDPERAAGQGLMAVSGNRIALTRLRSLVPVFVRLYLAAHSPAEPSFL